VLLVAATIDGRVRHALGLLHDGPEGAVWIHRWCRRIMRAIGIECVVEGGTWKSGEEPAHGFEAVVCNHLSYIDILLMSAARPFVMVAKTEVRRWPLLGWLTAQAGTVYVDRGGKPETYPRVNTAMAAAYRSGLPVLFFPEGTTTDGLERDGGVLPFRRCPGPHSGHTL
jgi:1-acyl-sn-glycerol-3-phosphate acyltransferase